MSIEGTHCHRENHSNSVFMAGDLAHDVCANETGAADDDDSHSSRISLRRENRHSERDPKLISS